MPIPARLRRATHASAKAAIPNPLARRIERGAAAGEAAASNAAGRVMPAAQNKSLELGTIMQASPRHGNLLQDLLDHFDHAEPLDLKFRTKDQPVFQYRNRHALDVVGRDKIATGYRGPRPRCHD